MIHIDTLPILQQDTFSPRLSPRVVACGSGMSKEYHSRRGKEKLAAENDVDFVVPFLLEVCDFHVSPLFPDAILCHLVDQRLKFRLNS